MEMIKDIEKLIEKCKTYPNYKQVLAEMSGLSTSYVEKMILGERKLTMEFIKQLLKLSSMIDKERKSLEKQVAKSIHGLAESQEVSMEVDGSMVTL